jgi:hypothetical protein
VVQKYVIDIGPKIYVIDIVPKIYLIDSGPKVYVIDSGPKICYRQWSMFTGDEEERTGLNS